MNVAYKRMSVFVVDFVGLKETVFCETKSNKFQEFILLFKSGVLFRNENQTETHSENVSMTFLLICSSITQKQLSGFG